MSRDFTYQAVDAGGNVVNGTIEAESRAAAMTLIEQRSLHPVNVKEAAARTGAQASASGRVSRQNVDSFTRELANLLAGGVPLNRALKILSQEASQPAARKRWEAIREDVVGGSSLAAALEKWPSSFPPVFIAMVRAGEAGGFVDKVLLQIAEFRQRERDLLGRVYAALIYPIVLAVLATCIMIVLMTYFIPRFKDIFASFGGALPLLTRGIVYASELLVKHGLILLVAIVIVAAILRRTLSSDSGRRWIERMILKTPALGEVVARFALVRFCRMLGTLLGAGVPLISALTASREAIGNQTLSDAAAEAVKQVQHGAPLARSLASCPQLFPMSVIEMVAVGEETGRLDKELVRLSETYEVELDRRLRILVALAEPAMLFIMAALIGTIVIGMLLPIFTLQDLVR